MSKVGVEALADCGGSGDVAWASSPCILGRRGGAGETRISLGRPGAGHGLEAHATFADARMSALGCQDSIHLKLSSAKNR